jgi:Papain-like cysteine protease AvrRpt2
MADVLHRPSSLFLASRQPVAALGPILRPVTGGLPTWTMLDYKVQTQTESNWCWLTQALSIHKWYDRTSQLTQCQVAGHMLNRSDTCTNPSSAANNVGGHVYEVMDWLGNRNGGDQGVVPLADLQGQIDARHPVATDVWWSGGGGHSVAVAGYSSAGGLSIEDPITGTNVCDYTTFKTAYHGSGAWGDSYYSMANRIDICGGGANASSRPALVSRMPGQLDAFTVGTDGHVYTAAWNEHVAGGAWQGWWRVGNITVPTGGAVTAVARMAEQLDIFVVGTDGRVYTAAWNQNVAGGAWQGWWGVAGGAAMPGAPVGAVARMADQLDIFVVGTDGHVYTAAWNQNVAGGAWQGWWRIGSLAMPGGGSVTAVARATDQLDIFAVASNGQVCTAAWNQNVASGQWQGWWGVVQGLASPGAAVGAVARMPQQLDIFVVGTDGRVYTAAWNQNVAAGAWQGWWTVAGGRAAGGAPVTVASRFAEQLDVFVVGTDGHLYTAAWNQYVASGAWQGWWRVSHQATATSTAYLSAVARGTDSLDVAYVDGSGELSAAAWAQSIADANWRG